MYADPTSSAVDNITGGATNSCHFHAIKVLILFQGKTRFYDKYI